MDINRLEVGMTVKNYKAMCELLGEEVLSGNSKKYQLIDWERFFKYRKQGHKFIIEEIYSEPAEKVETRGRKSIYGDIIEVLLMDLLSRNNGRILISKSKLSKELGFVNDNYSIGYGNQGKMSTYLDIELDYVKDFYNVSNTNISYILESALKSLEDKKLIDKNVVTMVKYSGEKKYNVATEFDRVVIQEIERGCMEHFGIESSKFPKRDSTYYKYMEMRKSMLKSKTNIVSTYKGLDIVVNKKYIEKAKFKLSENIMSELDRQGKLKELNSLFADNVMSNAQSRHENFTSSEKMLLVRFSKIYVSCFEKMKNELIDLSAVNIDMKKLSECEITDEDLDSQLPF